jgi:hypothetical protein
MSDILPTELVAGVLSKRKENRISGVLPVKISARLQSGELVFAMAHTLDLSMRGARLSGVAIPLAPGMMIRIERGRNSAAFRVVWKQNQQFGVEAATSVVNLWGLSSEERGKRTYS